ncbi:23S rRNA pseudouridine1911/1915/1917 synthase [Deinococcus metalli]|uniref:Pseudouridine synthase n=1 Tax=Deinococcus metalli TaxID=1141878 RepID=A0A7W8KG32_9DEIO|nr:RluA family pseudouridine synthase [Deinococcus metalli]MBB5377477.1 23S rRNA pseudouridine1911/1915/1917 synthase [Deinococcus metalli]
MTLNRGYAYTTAVPHGGQTVLAFLSARYTHSDAATWAARLAAGEVELDGARAHGPEVLRAGQVLVWHRPPWPEADAPLHYGVLYEDGALLAVDKPSGLPTLPGGGFLEHTLLALVRRTYPGASPLHRLGRGTSGVVLFALEGRAGSALARDWRDHAVRKTYRALAAGVVGPDTLTVTAPIGPARHPRLGTVHAATPGGKPAHSELRVVERRRDTTLLDVDIRTGRPHQIRIHTAAAGHPLANDPLYAPGGGLRPELPGLPGDLGYALHAWRLAFTHPHTGQAMVVYAPLPAVLEQRGSP